MLWALTRRLFPTRQLFQKSAEKTSFVDLRSSIFEPVVQTSTEFCVRDLGNDRWIQAQMKTA
jgi:hypothetical protein